MNVEITKDDSTYFTYGNYYYFGFNTCFSDIFSYYIGDTLYTYIRDYGRCDKYSVTQNMYSMDLLIIEDTEFYIHNIYCKFTGRARQI